MLLFTLRSQALKPGQLPSSGVNLEAWLADLGREADLRRYHLGPVGDEEVSALLSALAAGPEVGRISPGFSRWLYAETEGHPLFILETLKALIEWGLIRPERLPGGNWRLDFSRLSGQGLESPTAYGLPPGIRDLIRARLARLSPAALSLLSAGATLGKRFRFHQVAPVSGLDEDTAISALDELLAAGLLVEAPVDERLPQAQYLFSHDKLREVVTLETNAARRKQLHRRAFEALQQDGAPAAELSHHALAAGLRPQGLKYSRMAGDQALRLYALREAIQHYRSALEVWESPGELTGPGAAGSLAEEHPLPGILLNLGRAYELLNELEPAQAAYRQMAAYASHVRRADLEVIALNRQATLLAWQSFDIEKANELLQQARRLAEDSGDRLSLAETAWNLAQLGLYTGDPQALKEADRALSLARELDRPDLVARSLNALAHVYTILYRWIEVEQAAGEACHLSERLGDRAMQAENLALISQAQVNRGRIDEGLASARRALSIAREIENAWGQAFASFALGMALVDAGEYEEALAVSRQGIEIASQLRFPTLRILTFVAYGVANLALFRADQTLLAFRQALELDESIGKPSPNTGLLLCMGCAAHALAGNWPEAAAAARAAVSARQGQPALGLSLPIWLEVEALLRAGEEHIARQDLGQISGQAADYPRQRFVWHIARAVLARWESDYPTALGDLEEAIRLARQFGSPLERLAALKELSVTSRVAGKLPQADEAFQQAEEILKELAEHIPDEALRGAYLARASQALARLYR